MKTAFKTCMQNRGFRAHGSGSCSSGGIPHVGSTARVADGALVVT
jgi:hypothetical protein